MSSHSSQPLKILVTGSSGMLGSDLVEVLSPHFEVWSLARRPLSPGQKNFIQLDLTDTPRLREKLLEIKPDIVIHAAAFTKVDLCEDEQWKAEARKQNTEVVKNLAGLCNQIQAFLIFFSTDYVFSGAKKTPYVEDDPIEPISSYGQTKALAEEVLRRECEHFMIFRITWLYGERGQHFPAAILRQAKEKTELSVVNDQWGHPTWTHDLAETLRDLLTSRNNLLQRYNKQIFHLGNRGETNWSGYAQYLLNQAGLKSIYVKEISSAELKRPAKRPMNSVLNLDKAKALLGIEMRPWQEALDEFLKTKVLNG